MQPYSYPQAAGERITRMAAWPRRVLPGRAALRVRSCDAQPRLKGPGHRGAVWLPWPRSQQSQRRPELLEVRVLVTGRRAGRWGRGALGAGVLRLNFSALRLQVVHLACNSLLNPCVLWTRHLREAFLSPSGQKGRAALSRVRRAPLAIPGASRPPPPSGSWAPDAFSSAASPLPALPHPGFVGAADVGPRQSREDCPGQRCSSCDTVSPGGHLPPGSAAPLAVSLASRPPSRPCTRSCTQVPAHFMLLQPLPLSWGPEAPSCPCVVRAFRGANLSPARPGSPARLALCRVAGPLPASPSSEDRTPVPALQSCSEHPTCV